ncbi:NAD(P)/FAD-dependent oxidoreductase [Arthrobacter caoxuetaonis]|uniref:NAD(P)/FAD-dependent oxidoreductase n=1 Tax=Arthrobacter caoxuetaonis TaxID=2886935 RepID=UPI001D138C91|nr:FAD-binding oxidoreductase [Arthrobacter caoxuetaonis]MCC3282192.1 FAD-binding oxidoreductase [Arthrobacter caoxuetaonis]
MDSSTAPVNGNVSFWYAATGLPDPRPGLEGDSNADVVIVGAGYTGLWTAYYLKKARPDLSVVVLESRFAGFGASGRNGGWLTNSISGGRGQYVTSHGRAVVGRFQELLNDTVDEVIGAAAAEGIDASIVKGGELNVARNEAQLRRLHALASEEAAWPEAGTRLLDAGETAERLRIAGALGSIHHPHCARINPARLVRGLADAVERLGVPILEGTTVTEIRPGAAVTNRGTVSARYILRATEGFTATLRGQHRAWLPMNSSMIATEPLPDAVWDEIGWNSMDTVADMAHAYMYAQRTADGRIALGGRGVPYRFGSRLDTDGATQPETITALTKLLRDMFPAAAGARIDHAWAGVLGVPRDWKATVGLDPKTGLGWAGGYVGTGVAATNLAGRTLRDLILEPGSELTTMPWVNRKVRNWEPEPLRWLGVKTMYAAYYAADRAENNGRRTTSPIAKAADLVSGR